MTVDLDDIAEAADALANLLDRTAGRPMNRDERRLEARYRSRLAALNDIPEEGSSWQHISN